MKDRIRTLIAAGLAGTLVLSSYPAIAVANTADELAAAAERLEGLGEELSTIEAELDACGEELESCAYDIALKQGEIDQTQGELTDARVVLGRRMRSSYKAGAESLLSVLLGAGSFEDLVSRIYYMDKVSDQDVIAIDRVEALQYRLNDQMAALEARQSDLERTLERVSEREAEYRQKVAEAADYYNDLDAQLQEELAAQAAAEAAERERAEAEAMAKAMEAIQREQETASTSGDGQASQGSQQGSEASKPAASTSEPASQGAPSPAPGSTDKPDATIASEGPASTTSDPEPEPDPDPEPATTSEPAPSTPTTPSVTYDTYGGGGVSSAYSCIGCPYEWGAAGPSSFDCSGLVCYCYGYGRGRTTYDMITSLKASGDWKTRMSELSYGDLIFTSTGHVGIYLGDGTFIHAPAPGRTVRVQEVFSFVGGGSYY